LTEIINQFTFRVFFEIDSQHQKDEWQRKALPLIFLVLYPK